jgi:hypothetical protein
MMMMMMTMMLPLGLFIAYNYGVWVLSQGDHSDLS